MPDSILTTLDLRNHQKHPKQRKTISKQKVKTFFSGPLYKGPYIKDPEEPLEEWKARLRLSQLCLPQLCDEVPQLCDEVLAPVKVFRTRKGLSHP